jgi:proteasome lid subunit RPN8/RPN11
VVIWPEGVLRRIVAYCEADPLREVCGLVVRRGEGLDVVHVPNVMDRYHAADPERFPRTSRDGYLMDPRTQLQVERDAAACGGAIVGVWHSHVEVGAYFSKKDRADAVIDGVPQVPGAEYLVVGVRAGRATEVRAYRYEEGDFVERPVALPS